MASGDLKMFGTICVEVTGEPVGMAQLPIFVHAGEVALGTQLVADTLLESVST